MAHCQARDSLASNTIRVRTLAYVLTRRLNEGSCMPRYYVQSILSEVYSADKNIPNGKKVDSLAIATLIRKGCTRRVRTPRFNDFCPQLTPWRSSTQPISLVGLLVLIWQ